MITYTTPCLPQNQNYILEPLLLNLMICSQSGWLFKPLHGEGDWTISVVCCLKRSAIYWLIVVLQPETGVFVCVRAGGGHG